MAERERIDERFRAQVEQLKPITVSWSEVEEQARRHRRIRLLVLVGATIALAILLTGALLAARTALDPTFEPPLISTASASGKVVEPKMGRGVVSKGEFLGRIAHSAVGGGRAGEEMGYRLAATVRVSDLRGRTLMANWRLRAVGESTRTETVAAAVGRAAAAAETIGSGPLVPDSRNETRLLRGWVPAPADSGRYIAEMVLVVKGQGAIERLKSKPFEVVSHNCCTRYVTPSYVAALPRGWRLESNYEPASQDRYVSRSIGPDEISIVIDTTLHEHGNPVNDEHTLESLLSQGSERYKRVAVRRSVVEGDPEVELSYWSGQHIYTDELFYRGGSGFGVLGESLAAHFRETRELCRAVVRSIRTREQEARRDRGQLR